MSMIGIPISMVPTPAAAAESEPDIISADAPPKKRSATMMTGIAQISSTMKSLIPSMKTATQSCGSGGVRSPR